MNRIITTTSRPAWARGSELYARILSCSRVGGRGHVYPLFSLTTMRAVRHTAVQGTPGSLRGELHRAQGPLIPPVDETKSRMHVRRVHESPVRLKQTADPPCPVAGPEICRRLPSDSALRRTLLP